MAPNGPGHSSEMAIALFSSVFIDCFKTVILLFITCMITGKIVQCAFP